MILLFPILAEVPINAFLLMKLASPILVYFEIEDVIEIKFGVLIFFFFKIL